jgi:phosphonate transport system permease protein
MAAVADLSRYDNQAARIATWRNRSRRIRYTAYFAIAALIAWSIEAIVVGDTDWSRISWAGMLKSARQFMSVDLSIFGSLMEPALETALMATMGTLVGLVLAVPVAWLGAMNISPLGRTTYTIGRGLMTLSRSVHEVVWALVFVAAVGLGALAGVLAMGIRSIGFISKTVAEAIEDVNPGPVEAMRAVGANRFQILLFGILPQVIPVFIGNVIFEWDVNIRRSTIMGLVGAGGLGLALHRQKAVI